MAVPLRHQSHGPASPSKQLLNGHEGNSGFEQPCADRVAQVMEANSDMGCPLRSSPARFEASDGDERIGVVSDDDLIVACDPDAFRREDIVFWLAVWEERCPSPYGLQGSRIERDLSPGSRVRLARLA